LWDTVGLLCNNNSKQFKLSATDLSQSGVDQLMVGERMPVGGCAVGMRMESCAAGLQLVAVLEDGSWHYSKVGNWMQ
jgi:hypothetical protein